MNSNLLASSVKAFPSSNDHVNDGKVTNEINLRTMISRLKTLNYKNSATDFELSVIGTNLSIGTGIGTINGTLVEVMTAVTVDCSSLTDGNYFAYIRLVYDASGHIKGTSGTDSEGITCEIVDTEPDPSTDYLYLGDVTVSSGSLTVATCETNIYPYDCSLIPNPNDVESTLADLLTTDIPDSYVSKVANDSKKGNLVFGATGSTKTVTIDNESLKVSNNNVDTISIQDNYISKTGVNTEPRIVVNADSVDIVYGDSKVSVKNTGTSSEIGIVTTGYDEQSNPINHNIKVTNSGIQLDSLSIADSTISTTLLTVDGNLTATGDIRARRVYNACYNDAVEWMVKQNKEDDIKAGDIVAFTDDGKVKLVENDADVYRLCGVVSSDETYGFSLGGDGYIKWVDTVPIALIGRVYLNINKLNKPIVMCGDLIAVTEDGNGLEVVENYSRRVVGKATETVALSDTKEVMIKV